ncbi:holo-[acyl-carrier protein] synthase [Nitrosomonas marina]|uniref:Holo-[acyl-carrier-protein] synthase n=1 Tax=Nitrosomonas marina TaxID=917 RepID=A0A1H9ZTB5_9PROT|nr:holo-ACP synthase [Nitrosomonas marina]SES84511.1 holo-[acyl-carrier protein] synthase [Nitrosomonas marina]
MIYGIGTDLVDPARIARSIERYGDKFARRILTQPEWQEYQSSSKPVLFLAGRFAAKEAFSKAIGTGLRHPVNLDFITIAHDKLGRPYFEFHPVLNRYIYDQGIVGHFLSISDEMNAACAFVVLEK